MRRNGNRQDYPGEIRHHHTWFWVAVLVFCAVAPALAQSIKDYQVKAVFLYNFANFVSWPRTAFENPSSPITYCVMSRGPVEDALATAIAGETVKGRPLRLRLISNATESAGCHVLFVGATRVDGLFERVGNIQANSTLTVSDAEDFAARGGMIGLIRKNNRIHPEINLSAVKRGGLQVSSKLLRLATVINNN